MYNFRARELKKRLNERGIFQYLRIAYFLKNFHD